MRYGHGQAQSGQMLPSTGTGGIQTAVRPDRHTDEMTVYSMQAWPSGSLHAEAPVDTPIIKEITLHHPLSWRDPSGGAGRDMRAKRVYGARRDLGAVRRGRRETAVAGTAVHVLRARA